MAYDIRLLSNSSLSEKLYFFDANLWIKILRPPFNPDKKEERYLNFFQTFKSHPNHPKIAITSLVLSEVINRLLREYSMKKYIKEETIDPKLIDSSFFKSKYRKTDHFKIQYELLCDDIKSYHTLYELINDELGSEIKSKHILKSPPKGLDFNDHYYFLLAKYKNIPIVTDDADFFVDGVTILTYNDGLYQRGKDSVKPKS